jgi:hypothetical protein
VCRPTSYIFPGLILVALKAVVSAGPIVFFPRNFPVSPTRVGGGQTRSVSVVRGPHAVFHFASSAPSFGAIGTLRGLPDFGGPTLPLRTLARTVSTLAPRSTDPQRSAIASRDHRPASKLYGPTDRSRRRVVAIKAPAPGSGPAVLPFLGPSWAQVVAVRVLMARSDGAAQPS